MVLQPVHELIPSFDRGISLRSSIGFFASSGHLAMTAVRHSDAPAILIAAAGRRCSSAAARINQSLKPCSASFNNWLLLSIE